MKKGDTGQHMIGDIMVEWVCVDPGYPESRGDWRGDDPAEPPTIELSFGNDGGFDAIGMTEDDIITQILEGS